jgi:FkbM family methyltransferase
MKTFLIDLLYKILGNRISCRLGRSLYLRSRFEVENNMETNGEIMVQHSIVNSGLNGVIFDVGANYGMWTKQFNSIAPHMLNFEIHTFEPCESNFNINVNNLSKCENIKTINNNFALSSSIGIDKMFVGQNDTGSFSLHDDLTSKKSIPTVEIKKDTIENYCQINGIEKILLVKVDTEGNDYEVIKGAYKMFLNENITALQFEYNLRWIYSKHFLKEVFDLFVGLPYKIGKISREKVYFYDDWHPELERFFEGNYLIVHKDKIDIFPHLIGDFDLFYVYTINK